MTPACRLNDTSGSRFFMILTTFFVLCTEAYCNDSLFYSPLCSRATLLPLSSSTKKTMMADARKKNEQIRIAFCRPKIVCNNPRPISPKIADRRPVKLHRPKNSPAFVSGEKSATIARHKDCVEPSPSPAIEPMTRKICSARQEAPVQAWSSAVTSLMP